MLWRFADFTRRVRRMPALKLFSLRPLRPLREVQLPFWFFAVFGGMNPVSLFALEARMRDVTSLRLALVKTSGMKFH